VLVQAHRRRRDPEVGEQLGGVPGVFGGDEIGFAEQSQPAQCHVLEVADGSRDQNERAGHGGTAARYCTIATFADHVFVRASATLRG
jgi:hypothetical protein